MQNSLDNTEVSKLLGKQVEYPRYYDKSILVRELRQNNRDHLGFDSTNLPFVGFDVWNAWEISTLTDSGFPLTAIAKIRYPASSKYIVESKSLKLYLNSFNMSCMGRTPSKALHKMLITVTEDLENLLETEVNVNFFPANVLAEPGAKNGFENKWIGNDWVQGKFFRNLESAFVNTDHKFTVYQETPSLLRIEKTYSEPISQGVASSLLKSNCRVTKQSDWGDVFIYQRGKNMIDELSLLEYIISFRDECHFHEEIAECIYKRLWDRFEPQELLVACLYVRRGGIDINPIRASHIGLIPENLKDPQVLFTKGPRQ